MAHLMLAPPALKPVIVTERTVSFAYANDTLLHTFCKENNLLNNKVKIHYYCCSESAKGTVKDIE
ncbi:MAG: hypothetical protein OXC30_01010 [Alphaproteobacteria bacterium]|nr:hypothetical protein [Alphaproteobacteria bacterium]